MNYGKEKIQMEQETRQKWSRNYEIDKSKYMTMSEVAEKYGVNLVTVRNRIKQGVYPNAVFVKHCWFIPIEEVQEITRKPRGPVDAPLVEGYISRQKLVERSGCDDTYISHQINLGMFGDRLKIGIHVYVDRKRAEKYIRYRESMKELKKLRKEVKFDE